MTEEQPTNSLEIESKPNSGFERFISGFVKITNQIVCFDPALLDGQGRNVLRRHCQTDAHESVVGVAELSWRSADDRETCIEYKKRKRSNRGRKNRWEDVEALTREMQCGLWNMEALGPAFLHPSLADSTKLKPLDGARSIMAHLESNHTQFRVVVVMSPRTRN